ncbi:MAG TPA: hypothetical protein VGN52_20035 [Burkholderiales bacterium]|jgi:hypothetical protein
MKINPKLIAAAALSLAAVPAFAAVAVSVGEPGFYGSINLGGGPPPVVYNQAPVVAGPTVVGAPPVYLRVPAEHRAHWDRYCSHYNACGRPAYFVHEDWYHRHYAHR